MVKAPLPSAAAPATAILFRSTALFAILFQIRLIAADLSDTSIFTVTLLSGFAAAAFLSVLRPEGKQTNIAAALISIGIIPWAGRALIALPRLFIAQRSDTPAIILDSMLLNLDRNNFVSLFPYYWSAVSTWFSLRSRRFFRAAIIADAALLLFIYSVAHTSQIEIYRWPIVVIGLFGVVVFLQALALLFSMPPETKLRVKETGCAIAALLLIITAGGFLFLKPFQEQAVKMGGGLLEPKFFSLGFSKFLKLDSEISTKNDLMLIVKKDNDENILLRQMVLSGYSRKQGFYQIEGLDDLTHPKNLPGRKTFYKRPDFKGARYSLQEYFLVNVDASEFIAMKEPVSVTPYESWDASSFNSAYSVESIVSGATIRDLFSITASNPPTPEELGLSETEYKIYTDYGNDERYLSLAKEITAGYNNYTGKVVAVFDYLKYGDYRYSLKPGIAPDGDQLAWFLFNTKKGYCSYYAFALTLMLRSLGIPARVAGGFFIDPQTNTFDYYPVRSDMAHAWVEVAFPQYGWIEFDPTSEELAADEEFQFSSGVDPALFEKLMREILENRSELKTREGAAEESAPSIFNSFVSGAVFIAKNYWHVFLVVLLAVIFLYMRLGLYLSVFLTKNPRKKSMRLMKHACRLLRLAGLRRSRYLAEAEWALQQDSRYAGIYSMYMSSAAARFAPEYSPSDFLEQRENYKKFCMSYKKNVSSARRIVSWIAPPLAILFNAAKNKNIALFILLFLTLSLPRTSAQNGNGDEPVSVSADELFKKATEADYSELFDKAITLYREGEARFPDDSRFPWALGNLYYSRSLFNLAWDEYLKTEAIIPDNPLILIRMAKTAGYMSKDSLSVDYYERALEIDSENKEAIGSLGWMYFKVHRLSDGERLLVSALERFGDDADFSMTLGTVYSDMYRYDESKHWYNKAITMGKEISDNVFTSIAWYNLSILESRFYRYDLCMEATNSSLNILNRASGRLALGELYMRQLELEKAQKNYESAYEIDTSPLAKLNLAQIYQISGKLEEARLYAEDCLKSSDHSWMLNFGIDPDRYKRDIHLILANAYSGLANTEQLTPWLTFPEKTKSLLRFTLYKLKHAVNIRLYRKYCLAAANAYSGKIFGEGGPHLDSYIQYFRAFRDYPRRALTYLNQARVFETNLIPAAAPSYDIEEGIITGDETLVEDALHGFEPLWEKEYIAQCYSEFANPEKRKPFADRRHKTDAAAEELFILNRGALRQNGIKLPLFINFSLTEETTGAKRNLEKALAAAGFKKAAAGTGARFILSIKINGTQHENYSVSCELADTEAETEILRHTIPLRDLTRGAYYNFARTLGNLIFTVE